MSTASVLFDAPGPRARTRNAVATLIAALLAGAVIAVVLWQFWQQGQFTVAKWEPFLTPNLWKTYLLPGIQGTLTAAALSIVLALVLGFVLGVGRLSRHGLISWPCAVIVEVFRAIPVLIMMIFSFALYGLLGNQTLFGTNYTFYDIVPSQYQALIGVVTGLTLYNGAVIAEIVRAGVNALPSGQAEAASALGLRWGQTMRSILLPQAVTSMLPVLVSQMVVVLKDTAIGYQILFLEVVRQATNIGSAFSNYIPALMVVGILLIAINFALSAFATRLERRLRRSRRGPAPLHADAVEQEGAPGVKAV